MPKQYYVLREYSHTDKRCLWSVLSRAFKSILSASDFKDSEESYDTKKKKPKYFIVERLSDEEVERRIQAGEQFNLD